MKKGVTFTEQEIMIIGDNPASGIMKLFTTDVPQEVEFLRQPCTELTKEDILSPHYAILKNRMLATVNDPDNPGVGIAAPQVGIGKQLILVMRADKEDKPFEFYPNCSVIEYRGDTITSQEGCLSVTDGSYDVMRYKEVVIRYLDETTLEYKTEVVLNYTAIIFQHETDHLSGKLICFEGKPAL